MKAYGKKKTFGYLQDADATWCYCCTTKYAKLGRKWRKKCKGMKKRSRQRAKKEIRSDIDGKWY